MTRGERLATFFTLIFHGQCGPFGEGDPILTETGNTMILYSQAGDVSYTFNEDDSVDVWMHENAWRELLRDNDIDPDLVDEDDIPKDLLDLREVHYDHVRDLLHSDNWFLFVEPKVIERVLEDYI